MKTVWGVTLLLRLLALRYAPLPLTLKLLPSGPARLTTERELSSPQLYKHPVT